ncbi:MAG: endonuclease/exonuclease/phosphatase family protein [Burkholderiales bacterium]|nr:endonuclease/exonuclease/phosphatase family protein [Anaerolineae bacterium]
MSLRIATYNIRFGGKEREHLLLDVLREINADAVMLTEASSAEIVNKLAASLAMQQIIAHGRKTSIALLSRLPIEASNVFDVSGRPLLEATLRAAPQMTVTLYGLHLPPHYLKRAEKQRVLELGTYLDYIHARPSSPHLLLGDFNAIASGDPFTRENLPFKVRLMLWWERGRIYHEAIDSVLAADYVDCFRTLHPSEAGFTLPAYMPHVRLDCIFADAEMREKLKACAVHQTPMTLLASDHLPLIADFAV